MNKKTESNALIDLYNQGWDASLKNGHEDHGDLDASLQFIKKLDIPKTSKILEIGCSMGKLCHELGQMGFSNVSGVDISETIIRHGQKKYPHLNLNVCDPMELNFLGESLDICLSFDVVEHIHDIENHFQEVIRILKPSGKYIFQTPNVLSNSIRETIQTRSFSRWKEWHPSLQSCFSLKKKLKQAGFNNIEFVKISPLTKHKLESIPFMFRYVFMIIPWTLLPLCLQTNFFVIAEKI